MKVSQDFPTLQDARVAVLIDVQYLYHSTKSEGDGVKVDYSKLMNLLMEEMQLQITRTVAFVLDNRDEESPDPGFMAFIKALEDLGIDCLMYKPRHYNEGGRTKSYRTDCTVQFTTEAILLAQKNDALVLITGNGDYAYLTQKLRALGSKTVVLAYRNNTSKELRESANAFIDLGAHEVLLARAS